MKNPASRLSCGTKKKKKIKYLIKSIHACQMEVAVAKVGGKIGQVYL